MIVIMVQNEIIHKFKMTKQNILKYALANALWTVLYVAH